MNSPIGSIDEKRSVAVQGTGGRIRHSGKFSESNPYLEQLEQAFNNQDKDALYELAIQWEADYANLQEQREYDDPVNQIQRQRKAGINPDLSGSSGSGGSSVSSGSSAQIADQTGQTKFSNSYDNTALAFEGINTAANLVGSFTGAYGNIISGISQLKTIPSQISLNEANAGLASANANEVNTLLDGKKKSIDLSNIGSYMSQVGELSMLLKNGFTDEEGSQLFKTLGIPEDQRGQLLESIRGVHTNPALLEKFHTDSLNARKAQWSNKIYGDNVVEQMTKLGKDIALNNLQFGYANSVLMNSVETALMEDPNYIHNVVATELNNKDANAIDSNIRMQVAYADAEAWGNLFDEKKALCKKADQEVENIKKKAEEDGKWTDEEYGNYNVAKMKADSMKGALSSQFDQLRNNFIEVLQKKYERQRMMQEDGDLRNMDFIGAVNYFSGMTFDNVYNHLGSTGEIVRGWIGTSAGAVRDVGMGVGAVVGGSRVGSIGMQETQRGLYNSKTGEWVPQESWRTVKNPEVKNVGDIYDNGNMFNYKYKK